MQIGLGGGYSMPPEMPLRPSMRLAYLREIVDVPETAVALDDQLIPGSTSGAGGAGREGVELQPAALKENLEGSRRLATSVFRPVNYSQFASSRRKMATARDLRGGNRRGV